LLASSLRRFFSALGLHGRTVPLLPPPVKDSSRAEGAGVRKAEVALCTTKSMGHDRNDNPKHIESLL
jgi:hypothetical protein